jgi:hypothetical protein
MISQSIEPVPPSIRPIQSYFPVAASVTAITAAVNGNATQNTQRQMAMSITQAAKSGPSSGPKPWAHPNTPTAKPRRARGNELTTANSVAGTEMPIPMPWMRGY